MLLRGFEPHPLPHVAVLTLLCWHLWPQWDCTLTPETTQVLLGMEANNVSLHCLMICWHITFKGSSTIEECLLVDCDSTFGSETS